MNVLSGPMRSQNSVLASKRPRPMTTVKGIILTSGKPGDVRCGW